MNSRRHFGIAVFVVVAGMAQLTMAHAATSVVITSAIDESQLVELVGNTRPEATAANDRGRVADELALQHMQMLLRRSPAQEHSLAGYIDELHTPGSPNFHHWLTAAEFGRDYGAAPQDIQVIKRWLTAHRFKVNVVYSGGSVIDFSGTAGDVRGAFHTEIHRLESSGVKHIANMANPKIPAALAPVIAGVVSLHDFRPHPTHTPRAQYTSGSTHAIVPPDLATIYNFNPLFSEGISGQGQTIVVLEDTDVYNVSDWSVFRSTFGLSGYSAGTFVQVHPKAQGANNNCSNPGINADDFEAALDAQWASAAAPSATILLASCADTNTTFGGLIALQNVLNASSGSPAIVSLSYGECEAYNGATANAAYASAYAQGVVEGVSVFVSTGDEGAASCDAFTSSATHGIGVSGFASTPYNVAVGGTDFGDTYAGSTGTYWNAVNTADFSSAKSYIPEIPWDDSCANSLLSAHAGFTTPYGSTGFCNSTQGQNFLTTGAGSGGPSGCATGTPNVAGVVGGSCAGTPKPTWQTGVDGIPADGVRDLPDVSLFAGNGAWGHYYVICFTDLANGGSPCSGAPSGWAGAGGTSFATPIMAGIQALVNQSTGARQGNPNYVYYKLAAGEYGQAGSATCNSTSGIGASANCIFYDVTLGDNDVNCSGTFNCYAPSAAVGVLSTSNSSYAKAYGATTGWDYATGIGTVNAYNLVKSWNSVTP